MSNQPRKYPDGFIRRKSDFVSPAKTLTITDADLAQAAARHKDLLYARRIRHVSRVMIVATKVDVSADQIRHTQRKKAFTAPFIFVRSNALRFAAVLFLCGFAVSSLLLPLLQANNEKLVQLNQAQKLLVGDTRDDAAKYLKYDDKRGEYTFAAETRDTSDTYDHTGRQKDAYEAILPKKASSGITVTDTESKINITLTPQFFTTEAEKSDGNNLIYRSGNRQLIYTLKYNGLKEDIILPSYQGDELQFNFRLSLPAGVEARLDSSGNIGIYSSDPTLFGNISFGNNEDRSKVEKAREKSPKNNLVMTIPYPVVKDAKGQEFTDKATYTLGDKQTEKRNVDLPNEVGSQLSTFSTYNLSVHAKNLKPLLYPISIDPTIQISSSAAFSSLNNEGGASIDTTNNLIKRFPLTGGAVEGWTQSATNPNTLPVAGYGIDFQIYNGFLYYVKAGTNLQYAPINNDGSLGSFIDTGISVSSGNQYGSTVIYNGYIYTGTGTQFFYAKIKADGSVSAFTSTNVFTTPNNAARGAYSVVAGSGYIYMSGGKYCLASCNDLTSTYTTDVQYAKINGDGSLGAWASAGAAFANGRALHKSVIYNGFFYILGGWQGSLGSAPTNVQFAVINSDGSLGSWVTTTAMSGTRTAAAILALDGYLYALGGSDITSTVHYAPIYADGTIGTWTVTDQIANGRGGLAGATYKDTIYIGGGSSNNGATLYADVQYTRIKPAGETSTWTTLTNQFATGRGYAATTAYNGYLYVSGGCASGSCGASGTFFSDVQYAPLNADGTIGSWTATNSFTTGRRDHDLVAYNGYMYITGGLTYVLSVISCLNDVQYAKINSDGTLGAWTTDSHNMTVSHDGHATVASSGNLYVIGGDNGSTSPLNIISTVEYAPIGSNGALVANFQTTSSLPQGRSRLEGTAANGRIYVMGGCTSYNSSNECDFQISTISYATINANGSLSSWTNNSPGVNSALYDYGGVHLVNGMFYIIGAQTSSTAFVRYAPLNADGTVGAWTTSSATLNMISDWRTTTYNGYLYTVGGGASRSVSFARVNNGGPGNTTAWTTDSSGTFTARMDNGVAAYNGYLYVMGGCTNISSCAASVLSSVEYAPFNDDGSVGTWTSTASLPIGVAQLASTVQNGYIYVSGGFNSSSIAQSSTYYAQLAANGALAANSGCGTSWCLTSASFSTGRYSHAMAVYNNRMYVINGCINGGGCGTYLNSIQFGNIGANGDITSWSATTIAPNTASQYGVRAVINNGYLYILLGTHATGFAGIYYAAINADGTISSGAWKLSSELYFQTRILAAAVAVNGYLYVLGGGYASSSNSDVQYAAFGATGELSKWQRSKDMNLVRDHHAATIYNGRIYQAGGNQGGAAVNNTQYTSLLSIPRIAQVSKLYDFDSGVRPTKLITRGTKKNGSATAVSYSSSNSNTITLNNNQSVTDANYFGAKALSLNLGSNRSLSQYLFLRYTIDDSLSAVFPDSGNESTITDFDMYYIANPGERLRGGRSFTNGSDRGLDAQPQ